MKAVDVAPVLRRGLKVFSQILPDQGMHLVTAIQSQLDQGLAHQTRQNRCGRARYLTCRRKPEAGPEHRQPAQHLLLCRAQELPGVGKDAAQTAVPFVPAAPG